MFYVYILATCKNGVFYVGVTNDLFRRVKEHKDDINKGFTYKYHVKKLFYYEEFDDINAAIKREKKLKRWRRDWKIALIEEMNGEWEDLFYGLV